MRERIAMTQLRKSIIKLLELTPRRDEEGGLINFQMQVLLAVFPFHVNWYVSLTKTNTEATLEKLNKPFRSLPLQTSRVTDVKGGQAERNGGTFFEEAALPLLQQRQALIMFQHIRRRDGHAL